MENIDIDNIRKAVVVGILAEVSWKSRAKLKLWQARNKLQKYQRRKGIRGAIRSGSKTKRPHRLPHNWKDIAVDGWDGMTI